MWRQVRMKYKNALMARAAELLVSEFGDSTRTTTKVLAWNLRSDFGIVLQVDGPAKHEAHIWVPYPEDGQSIPSLALEYPGEAGRHSNTYPSPGLGRGSPALKLVTSTEAELTGVITYIKAFRDSLPLPEITVQAVVSRSPVLVDVSAMPSASTLPPRREAISRAVQREVWQRDGGQCVECGTREKLCFDHIVPFSRGGSNSIRNLQLLCERCNLAKGNRI
jgi:hypothetical protein